MNGFVDPQAPLKARLDRIDRLIAQILPTLDESALSPEARELMAEVKRGDLRRTHQLMAEDPLPDETTEEWEARIRRENPR
jgi:hypothetical protein